MSKRQTTGMPKVRKVDEAAKGQPTFFDKLLGNPTTRIEREEAINRLIIRGVGALIVVVAVLITFSVVYDQIIVPNQTVATVNGEAIRVSEFRERVLFERARLVNDLNSIASQAQAFGMDVNQLFTSEPYATWLNEVNFPDQLGRRVLDDLVNDTLARQEAAKLNVVVDDAAVQAQINSFFNYDPTAVALIGAEPTETPIPTETPTPFVSPTPSPTATSTPLPTATPTPNPEATAEATQEPVEPTPTFPPVPTRSQEEVRSQFEEQVRNYRSGLQRSSGVTGATIDAYFERLALQDAIAKALTNGGETTTYVNVRHILVATLEEALDVIAALEKGESFAALARAVSSDTGSGANGGELGWSPASNYVPEFKAAALTLPIGEISEPVQTQFGYHILQVRGREERAIAPNDRSRVLQATYAEWIKRVREENAANVVISDNWLDYMP